MTSHKLFLLGDATTNRSMPGVTVFRFTVSRISTSSDPKRSRGCVFVGLRRRAHSFFPSGGYSTFPGSTSSLSVKFLPRHHFRSGSRLRRIIYARKDATQLVSECIKTASVRRNLAQSCRKSSPALAYSSVRQRLFLPSSLCSILQSAVTHRACRRDREDVFHFR